MSSRKRRLVCALGLGLPLALALFMSLLMRPESGSLWAPLLGPWAGLAYGHHDCTMGTQFPDVALALVLLGAVSLTGVALFEKQGAFVVSAILAVSWAVAWELAALLSVVNTTA